MSKFIGAHIDYDDRKQVIDVGGNAIQMFMTVTKKQHNAIKNEILQERRNLSDILVIIHSSYLHNISKDWDEQSWWIRAIINEVIYCYYIGSPALVLHFGKYMELSKEEAFNNMYMSLIYIHNRTKKYKDVKILLETSAGQGTELCYDINDLEKFYKKISNSEDKTFAKRIKICLDTCHIFAAGYDISSNDKAKEFLNMFDNKIGLTNVRLLHFNNCATKLGERKDRHASLNTGNIDLEGLLTIYEYFYKKSVPVILETPGNSFMKEIPLLLELKY